MFLLHWEVCPLCLSKAKSFIFWRVARQFSYLKRFGCAGRVFHFAQVIVRRADGDVFAAEMGDDGEVEVE